MELNVWTSSTVVSATQDSKTKVWAVKVRKADGIERLFHVGHIVLATGFKGGVANVPTFPGIVGPFLSKKSGKHELM
jgi:cation diffusion facilitator CzcD-associated flavoprotein CzcO